MDIRNRRELKAAAAQALAANPGNPKRTVLVYIAVSAAMTLAVAGLDFILNSQISNTGGLSNLGLRSILGTVQYILPIVQTIVLICLEMGYAAASLAMARREAVTPRTLTVGARYFGPVLRAALIQGAIYLLLMIVSLYLSSTIFMMLPASNTFYDIMEPIMTDPAAVLDDATLMLATEAMLPMVPIFCVAALVLIVPVAYLYRMVDYCLLDSQRPGALAAMRESSAMMRRHRFQLFKLDLSFWWFYLLEGLAVLVCYGDLLLSMLGMTLPMDPNVAYFLFYGLGLAVQLGVHYLYLNRVRVTYANAYEALRPQPPENSIIEA